MATKNITDITGEIFDLLNPLPQEDRKRIVNAVFVLLGDAAPAAGTGATGSGSPAQAQITGSFSPKARQWLGQHRLTQERLEKIFYFQDGKADIHLQTIVGASKREQTINCYLLMGAKAFLESDIPTISDSDAIALCKHTQAYDKNNHTTNRKALGNLASGSKAEGLSLTGPGLKTAAELIRQLSSPSAG